MNIKDHGLSIRLEAIAMLKTVIEQKIVASRLGVGLRPIRRWWHNEKHGKDQDTKLRPDEISHKNPSLGYDVHRALSELHIIPPKQTINGAYYRDNILAKTCSDATNRTADTDPILERSMLADMSDFLFMQDDAPPHTANLT
ncbi:hypothetical protein LOD99_10751 [Oopsacas minuta]|uniref:Transposase n=1 Tax=Oopsacas minuta TaxID=111878 RepID=A0AAV7KE47_9METZ|nr:hypothetical protein LOD99_10751 [Oopsacas minuta]